jgi:hypothetical protein
MGEHSAPANQWASLAISVWTQRRKIASALIVALPFAARFVPDFPSDAILSVLRAFLGA